MLDISLILARAERIREFHIPMVKSRIPSVQRILGILFKILQSHHQIMSKISTNLKMSRRKSAPQVTNEKFLLAKKLENKRNIVLEGDYPALQPKAKIRSRICLGVPCEHTLFKNHRRQETPSTGSRGWRQMKRHHPAGSV